MVFFDNRESGVNLEGNPDFVKLAEAYGIKGYNIKRPADVGKVLQKALDYNDGPCVINAECIKTENVFPMIPAGAALEEYWSSAGGVAKLNWNSAGAILEQNWNNIGTLLK